MFGLIPVNVIVALAIAVSAFTGGWMTNGWRWSGKLDKVVAAQAAAILASTNRSREVEQVLTAQSEAIRDKKDAEIKLIRSQLDSTLISLRQRPARSSGVPSAASNGRAATGAQLSREDAEFLARESSRADEVVAELLACYAKYSTAQRSLR